jgi:hypothetical protein
MYQYRIRRVIHSPVLVNNKSGTVRNLLTVKLKSLTCSHRSVNSPIEYKQIIISQLPHGEILKCKGQKRVANLGYFLPKKGKLADSFGVV